MDKQIADYYNGKVMTGDSGAVYSLDVTSISPEEGEFIHNLLKMDENILKTLEVGCAWGLSSLFICSALSDRKNAHHTILDPFQSTQWDNVGIRNLETGGYSKYELLEEKSEIALPCLLKDNVSNFDFIFIDGWHTFDHTLLDIFYSLELLKINGILVIDDVSMTSVRQAVDFILQFDHVELIERLQNPIHQRSGVEMVLNFTLIFKSKRMKHLLKKYLKSRVYYVLYPSERCSMVAIRKTGPDSRVWNWHSDAF